MEGGRVTLTLSRHRDRQGRGEVASSAGARKLIQRERLILIENGQAIERNLRGELPTLDDVTEQARGNQIDRLDDVKWAVLEASGTITFIKK